MLYPGNQHTFDPFPESLNPFSMNQFRHLGKQFMTVIQQFTPSEPAGQVGSRKGIQVIGNDQSRPPGKEQCKKEPDIIACIKKCPVGKYHPVPANPEFIAGEWRALSEPAPDTGNFQVVINKQPGDPVQTLVGDQIIDDDDINSFHGVDAERLKIVYLPVAKFH
jgi:hypothetical protein